MRRKILANEQISNGLLLEFSLYFHYIFIKYGQRRITFDNFLNLLVCQLFGVLGFVIKHSPRIDPGGEGGISSYWVVSTPNAVEGRSPRENILNKYLWFSMKTFHGIFALI